MNALLLFLAPATSTLAERLNKRDVMLHLRRPSQFIGLDRIASLSPPTPLHTNNFPIIVASIDGAHGNRVFDNDPGRYLGHSGGISSERQRIRVADTVSTIIKFRAIDRGMETCELHIDLPSQQPNSTSYSGRSVSVSLYRIDASSPIDAKTLTYDTRPARLFKLDDISMVAGPFHLFYIVSIKHTIHDLPILADRFISNPILRITALHEIALFQRIRRDAEPEERLATMIQTMVKGQCSRVCQAYEAPVDVVEEGQLEPERHHEEAMLRTWRGRRVT